ncbi:ATP-binding protein [Saccharothrix deserti]|uniref:ATP-binding protein n=1 Tax=Saccharothrix deserti TaxID=2593674 RepID=UPI00131E6088|nr:ATP-binding protein [Saccharothrix deserti]
MSAGHDTVVLVMEDRESPPRAEVEVWLRERLDGWLDHEVLLVGTVVGELVDNARRYGAPPYVLELVLDRWTDALTIRVRNRAPRHTVGWSLGAGLLIVSTLTEQWGVVSAGENTTVWAKVRFDD